MDKDTKEIIEFLDDLNVDSDALKLLVVDLIDQLEDSYSAFKQLLASVPGSFMLFDAKGEVVAASARMRTKFLQSDDIIGKSYDELEYPFFNGRSQDRMITDLIRYSLKKGKGFDSIVIDPTNHGEGNVLVELNLQIIRDHKNKICSVLMSFVENIVRLNMLPGNLEKDHKLKKLGSLAAGLVHEIKNPIQSISTITQLLQYKYPDDKFLQQYLDSAMTEINRVSVILGEYLTFSGNNQEYMAYTHINDICEDVLKITDGNIFMNEIEIEIDLSEDIPMMILDIGRMKQVLVNLITNSVDAINALREQDDFTEKYPDYKGVIKISTAYNYQLNECYVKVEDNGIGMEEETLAAISKPFFTTKRYGTGIGVSISKNIIRNHGGRLKIESCYGKGSVFTVILPELAGLMELAVKEMEANAEEGFAVSRLNECMEEDYCE
ncbi:MAG: two-component system sensor histidine kinase NtrB [Bacillota bacterium]|jgi:signal transduction histidine kinase